MVRGDVTYFQESICIRGSPRSKLISPPAVCTGDWAVRKAETVAVATTVYAMIRQGSNVARHGAAASATSDKITSNTSSCQRWPADGCGRHACVGRYTLSLINPFGPFG